MERRENFTVALSLFGPEEIGSNVFIQDISEATVFIEDNDGEEVAYWTWCAVEPPNNGHVRTGHFCPLYRSRGVHSSEVKNVLAL